MYTLFAYMRNTINLKVLLLERDHLCQEHNLDSKRNANCFTFSREIDLGLFCFCLVCMKNFNTIFKGHYSIYFIGLCITRHWHLKWHFQTLQYYMLHFCSLVAQPIFKNNLLNTLHNQQIMSCFVDTLSCLFMFESAVYLLTIS